MLHKMCDQVNNRKGKHSCNDFDENSPTWETNFGNYVGTKGEFGAESLNISPRISDELFQPTGEGSSDEVSNVRSELHLTPDKSQCPRTFITGILKDEVVDSEEIANTPNMKASVNSSEVEEKANNPSWEEGKQTTPLVKEELCAGPWQEEQPTAPSQEDVGRKCGMENKDFELSKKTSKDDDGSGKCGMEHKDSELSKKTSKDDDGGGKCGMEHKDSELSKKTSKDDGGGGNCGMEHKDTELSKKTSKDDGVGGNCGMEHKNTELSKKTSKDDGGGGNCGMEHKDTELRKKTSKDDDGVGKCGMEHKDRPTELSKKTSKDGYGRKCGMEHRDTRESRKTSKDDDSRGCVIEEEDTEESKKTFPNDYTGNECKEGDESYFLVDLFKAFFAFGQSCRGINICNIILPWSSFGICLMLLALFSFFHKAEGSLSEPEEKCVEQGDLVRLPSFSCSGHDLWYYGTSKKPEINICTEMKCTNGYKMENYQNGSCNFVFNASEENVGTYRNTDFNAVHNMSKSFEVKLSGVHTNGSHSVSTSTGTDVWKVITGVFAIIVLILISIAAVVCHKRRTMNKDVHRRQSNEEEVVPLQSIVIVV